MYKWYTSALRIFLNDYKDKYNLMQMDQRGAKAKCSGTLDNLLIDDMVLKDAHDGKRNLACCWVDVRKAYDSLSHSWMKRMLQIHRFPTKLQITIGKIMSAWNIELAIPLEKEDVISAPIPVTNGILQGDVTSSNLFTLSLNPIAWELRRYKGYTMSKPLNFKITHLLFVDDLKAYSGSLSQLTNMMHDIKIKMQDSGLEWNRLKSKVINMKRGILDTSQENVMLKDGTKIPCIHSEQNYKFLGVPENVLHRVEDLVTGLKEIVQKRTNVIWTSPLSDYNKVIATNIFVHSMVEYYMASEKFNLGDMRDMDGTIRKIMSETRSKYSLQMNESIYLPRSKGGRGLKNFEQTYKKTRIKTGMKLLTSKDPNIICVKKFDKIRMDKGKSSIIKDSIKYAKEDFDTIFEPLEDNFLLHYDKDGVRRETAEIHEVKDILKTNEVSRMTEKICKSSWQGVILSNRYKDSELMLNKCFTWLTKWKDCPTEVINEIQSLYLQTIPTLTFTKFRGDNNVTSTICRLCAVGNESVRHLLSTCQKFLSTTYKRRHDRALQLILFKYLHKEGLISTCPAWYTKLCIKPKYENEGIVVFWDIPEYSGHNDNEARTLRPDGKIILKAEKVIFVLEMSVPWVENRDAKYVEKEDKYVDIVQNLKIDNPGFKVSQLTFIMDCLGGSSKSLTNSLKELKFTTYEIESLLFGM